MKKQYVIILILLVFAGLLIGLSSCGKNNSGASGSSVSDKDVSADDAGAETETAVPEKDPTIYISGWYVSSTNIPGYWKEGEFIELEPAGSRATGIFVSGDDVYVSGDKSGAAIYWKNGEKIGLTSADTFGEGATGIAAVGNDVYVIGKSQNKMTIWKNGEPNHVGDGQFAFIYDIFVSGSDVYVIGKNDDGVAYWKNGEPTAVADSWADGKGIFVSGGDVYAAGNESKGVCYWKNGQQVMLTNSSEDGYSLPEGISVYADGTDVYVAGMITEDDVRKGCLWKNGNMQVLEAGGIMFSYVSDMTMDDGSLYIAGSYVQDDKIYAAVWKDGEITALPVDAEQAYTSGITIVR